MKSQWKATFEKLCKKVAGTRLLEKFVEEHDC